jgi:hypothetical protein
LSPPPSRCGRHHSPRRPSWTLHSAPGSSCKCQRSARQSFRSLCRGRVLFLWNPQHTQGSSPVPVSAWAMVSHLRGEQAFVQPIRQGRSQMRKGKSRARSGAPPSGARRRQCAAALEPIAGDACNDCRILPHLDFPLCSMHIFSS